MLASHVMFAACVVCAVRAHSLLSWHAVMGWGGGHGARAVYELHGTQWLPREATARGTHGSAADSVTTARASSDRHESSGSSGCIIERPVVRARVHRLKSRRNRSAVRIRTYDCSLPGVRVDYRRRRIDRSAGAHRYKKDGGRTPLSQSSPSSLLRRERSVRALPAAPVATPSARCPVLCRARIRNTCRYPRTAASVDKLAPGGAGRALRRGGAGRALRRGGAGRTRLDGVTDGGEPACGNRNGCDSLSDFAALRATKCVTCAPIAHICT
jgi:hypothetical protein